MKNKYKLPGGNLLGLAAIAARILQPQKVRLKSAGGDLHYAIITHRRL